MHKVVKRCKNCKFCSGDHKYFYCSSKISSNAFQEIYPEDDNCEVFYEKRKPKRKKNLFA